MIVDIGFMSHVNTFDGYTCYLAAIDEGTRYKWITLLRRKVEATDAVIALIKYVERQYEVQVKTLSSDDDTLFDCNKIWNLCKTGMKQLLTHAHTPEEVSLVEKMNYTIKIKAVAILKSCGLPNSFWGECIKYVVATDNVTGCKR